MRPLTRLLRSNICAFQTCGTVAPLGFSPLRIWIGKGMSVRLGSTRSNERIGYYALGVIESRKERFELLPYYTRILV